MQSQTVAPIKLIRIHKVCEKTGRHRSSIYRALTDDPSFPKPVKFGARSIAFVESEIDQWIADRMAARDASQATQ